MLSKACTKCGIMRPLDFFPRQKKNKSGRDSRCKSCAAENTKSYRANNPDKVRLSQSRHYKENKAKRDAHVRKWKVNNPEKYKEWRSRTQTHRTNSFREWRRSNPGKCAAKRARRRAAKKRATPLWVNHKEIDKIYRLCAEVTEVLGEKHQVDHIIPLQGKSVCGLHVPWNLQILPQNVNASKGNRI